MLEAVMLRQHTTTQTLTRVSFLRGSFSLTLSPSLTLAGIPVI